MHDVVVIGGGLAGAAAATHLSRAGRDVLLLERSSDPHDKVCGEFLSFEAQEELSHLGVDLAALGAVPLRTVAVARGLQQAEAPLGFVARSLSRRVLDEALLSTAAQAGAVIRRGARVRSLVQDGAEWVATADRTFHARRVVLATGKHDLRGWGRPPGPQHDLLGFKSYWHLRDPAPLEGRVELHLFPGGYAGFQPVESGRANLCLVIRDSVFTVLGRRWDAVLSHLLAHCPGLNRHLSDAVPCAERPLAIARIPYGLVQERGVGPLRLGDQAAVIPSFTGEGMSIALHSARLAAAHLMSGEAPEEFQARLAGDVRTQVRLSTWASRGLVSPWGQAMLGRLLSPPLLRWGLHRTRMSGSARPWARRAYCEG